MKLTIIAPTKQTEHTVAWVEANTPDGNFVIQAEHAPTTLVLSPYKDLIYCFKTGKQEAITVENGGILEVQKEKIVIIVG